MTPQATRSPLPTRQLKMKLNKLHLTADIQLHNHSQFASVGADGINSRLKGGLEALDSILNQASKDDTILINGDVFETQKAVETSVLFMFSNWVRKATEKVNLILVTGNHDYYFRSGTLHSLRPFSLADRVTVIDEPTIIDSGSDLVMIHPYSDDVDVIRSWIKDVSSQSDRLRTVLLLHQSISGAFTGTGIYDGPLGVEDLLPEKFSLIALGHFHKPQSLAQNVVYLGSPYQVTTDEAGQSKRFLTVDFSKAGDFWHSTRIEGPEFVRLSNQDFAANAQSLSTKDYYTVTCFSEAEVKMVGKTAEAFGLNVKVSFLKPELVGDADSPTVIDWKDAVSRWLSKRGRTDLVNEALSRLKAA